MFAVLCMQGADRAGSGDVMNHSVIKVQLFVVLPDPHLFLFAVYFTVFIIRCLFLS